MPLSLHDDKLKKLFAEVLQEILPEKQAGRLITLVQSGNELLILQAGRPVAKLIAIESSDAAPRRLGILDGKMRIPENFNELARNEILDLFNGMP
jgi:antitoxin (DNA-binding transcriptional repressor) of toxin-antitoxin stability system